MSRLVGFKVEPVIVVVFKHASRRSLMVTCRRISLLGSLVFLGTAMASSAFAQLSPIWLRPGQCVMISNQQICAEKPGATDSSSTTTTPSGPTVSLKSLLCKWGAKDDSQPGLTGYGLYQMTVMTDGTKQEVLLKNFGPADRAGCEAAARAK